MTDNTIPTAEEVDLFFKAQNKIRKNARKIAELCTNINSRESIESIDCDDDEVIIGVWSQDCGNDSYTFPKEYLSMSVEAVKQLIEDKKRKETERRKLAAEKAKKTREIRKIEAERKKEEAEFKEYQRLKEKFG